MSGGDQGWQVGDLALCVSNGLSAIDWIVLGGGPVIGSITKVDDLHFSIEITRPGGVYYPSGIWLRFNLWPKDWFHGSCFRKIAPHTPDAEDDVTIALLNGQPATPAPARMPEPVS